MDFIIDKNGDVYIIEIGPRNGGNLITDAIKAATGIDLAKATVQAALGLDYDKKFLPTKNEFVASYITHALKNGIYRETVIENTIKDDIILFKDLVNKGDKIQAFNNAALDTGAMLIKFNSLDEMLYRMDNMEEFIRVEVE